MQAPADVNRAPTCNELGLPCLTPRTFPDFGVFVQAVAHVSTHVAVAAEASYYGNAWDTTGVDNALTNHVSSAMLGPRFTTAVRPLRLWNDTTMVRAYAQLLAGPERSTAVPTRFALQPGLGIDFKLSAPALWLRFEYDYRSTHGSPRNLSTSRVGSAVVYTPSWY